MYDQYQIMLGHGMGKINTFCSFFVKVLNKTLFAALFFSAEICPVNVNHKTAKSTKNPSMVLSSHLVCSSDRLCDDHGSELSRSNKELYVPHFPRALLGMLLSAT